MSYCTQDDILALALDERTLKALTNESGANTGEIDSAKVTAAIEQADAEIDYYICGRYTTPLSPVPAAVKGWSAVMAAWYVHRGRPRPQDLHERYQQIMGRLKAIRESGNPIPGAEASLIGDGGSLPSSTTEDRQHVFRPDERDESGNLTSKGNMSW